MNEKDIKKLHSLMSKLFRPHPWHGLDLYEDQAKNVLNAYIEIVPSDTVKYESDKTTGYLKVDRPQKFSNIIPALYGFLPKTYCGDGLASYTMEKTGRKNLVGDKDPLDICVLTEKHITHGDLLVNVIPIGGFRMIDHGEVDDKIIAVLKDDAVFGKVSDVDHCPEGTLSRLRHYFLTYKQIPGMEDDVKCEIINVYGQEEALRVIKSSAEDYQQKYNFEKLLGSMNKSSKTVPNR